MVPYLVILFTLGRSVVVAIIDTVFDALVALVEAIFKTVFVVATVVLLPV